MAKTDTHAILVRGFSQKEKDEIAQAARRERARSTEDWIRKVILMAVKGKSEVAR